MKSWMLPSFLALLLYGLWGFLGAKVSQFANFKTVFLVSCVGTMTIGLLAIPMISSKIELSFQGVSISLLQGLSTGCGTLMFFYALQRGPAIPIIMITALYPLVAVLLTALFLKQGLTPKQTFGIVFSMLAIYCLTIP